MREVKKRHPQTVLVIVGSKSLGNTIENDYVKDIKEQARRMSKDIIFTNYIPVDGISQYYTMSDVFVCPSQWQEPLARVQYEAMAAGLPIITTNRGGNPEVIADGRNGFVIDSYDSPKAMARAINKILDNDKMRKKMGEVNRNLVVNKYSFKLYADRISKLYRDLIARKK
jgi:glycosyltransferase involved in cell wall biosynthesis